jgi:protein-disulfide isomerase
MVHMEQEQMEPQQTESKSRMRRDFSKFYTPIAIVVAGALIAVGMYLSSMRQGDSGNTATNGQQQAQQGQQTQQAVDVTKVQLDNEPYIGQIDAPVTLVFWSDYQCPFCKAFEVGGVPQINNQIPPALPDIVKNYVDTGKVRVVFKDFPFLGQDSITAAEYGRAIWKLYPDQYFDWRTAMYTAQDEEGDQGFGDAASIDQLIKDQFSNMDDAKIAADVSANKSAYDKMLQADQQEGASFGVQGTPAFVTGTQLIPGDAPFSTFQAAIDTQLQ